MRRLQLMLVFATMLCAGRNAVAVDLTVTLPTITAPPGATILIPIEVAPNPTGFGIYSIDFQLPLNPAVVQSATSLSDGFLQFWGTPFVSATPSLVAAATGGLLPVTAANGRLNSIQLTLSPSAPLGTDMPLVFTTLRFNEGTPTIATVSGLVRVRGGTSVESGSTTGLKLAAPSPDPVRTRTRFAFTLPARGRARLTLHGIDGRRVRTLFHGELAAGSHDRSWDARDDAGNSVAAGVYFALLESGNGKVQRRVVVLP